MELALSFIPSFFLERLELVATAIRTDFDCRYQDSRQRRLLEFQITTRQEPSPDLAENAKRNYHWYDWDELFEWNERLDDERCLRLISYCRKNLTPSTTDNSLQALLVERLNLLEADILENPLSENPHWAELFTHRWRASLWREECQALYEMLERERVRPKKE